MDDGPHQGSASPRRGVVRFHSLETWLFRERAADCWRERVRWRRERDGVEHAFIAEQPSDGGIYRAGRGFRPGRGFEFPGFCVRRTN